MKESTSNVPSLLESKALSHIQRSRFVGKAKRRQMLYGIELGNPALPAQLQLGLDARIETVLREREISPLASPPP